MRQRIRSHLTYANVMSTLAVFLVIGGGTALASYVVSNNGQIGPNTVSGHKPFPGEHANIIAGTINGTDIADQSGVDTCKSALTKKFGAICAGSDGGSRQWQDAIRYCAARGLRLPTTTEAAALAAKYDVPGVSNSQYFWTDENLDTTHVIVIDEGGGLTGDTQDSSHQTVCVTDPSA
jgi:hypothetical protein